MTRSVQPSTPAVLPPALPKPRRMPSWKVFGYRNYALLFWGQLISSTGTQMCIVAVAWQVFLLTHSALALGLIGLFQAIPRIIFSLVGGLFADVFDRRKLLLVIQVVLATLSAVLALCTHFHVIDIFLIYGVVLAAASVSAFDFPARQAILPNLVPRERLTEAMPLYMAMIQLTGIVGPTVGGFVIAWLGLATTYWIDVISYAVVIGSLLLMTVPRLPVEKRTAASFRALIDGVRFLRTQPVILAVISLDFFATFFGSPLSLLPIFASTLLHTNAQGLGMLLAADALGAVALTPLSGQIGRLVRKALFITLAILVWGLCIIAFGLFPVSLWVAALFLAGAGAANMVSMLLRFLVIQMLTPDALRGRVSSVNAMFAFGGPLLGQLESGLIANYTSPQIAVISGGIACILATLVIVALVPNILRVQVKEGTTET